MMNATIRAITMPKWGIEMQEGLITDWTAQVGETLAAGDPLLDVETDKIVNTVESPFAGTLRRIVGEQGTAYAVGALIAVYADASVPDAEIDAFIATFKPAETGFEPTTESVPEAAPATAVAVEVAPLAQASDGGDGEGRVSPIARRVAQKLGVDLTKIKGTGPNGRISKEDVENYAASLSATAPATVANPSTQERLTPMRQTIARRLLESKQGIPHYRLERTVEVSALLAHRAALNSAAGSRVSVNDLLVRAVGMSLAQHPAVNAHLVGDDVIRFADADVAIAVATPSGLLTPVIRAANRKSVTDIGTESRDLAERARTGKLVRAEIEGGTFTISNLGMYGLDRFDAIINPPQVAILAVGAVRDVPVVREGAIVAGRVCTLTLSADHRVVDGAVGAAFLDTLAHTLGQPAQL
jgi:pyruvate dehydrogenase E2 component (dihydrolipoamide acetyltransferase)